MHITAAVYVNDDESGLIADIDDWLERLAPHEPVSGYRHNRGEDNADAHLKRQLMAHQVVLPITDGSLDLGPWEQVFYAEFDGRRRKRVVLKAIGDRWSTAWPPELELLDWKRRVFALYAEVRS